MLLGMGNFSPKLIATLVATAFGFLALGWTFWCLMRFWQRRDKFWVRNRKSGLTIICVISYQLFICTRIASFWLHYTNEQNNDPKGVVRVRLSFACFMLLAALGSFCGAATVLARVWAMYFDSQLALANSENQWISLVTKKAQVPDLSAWRSILGVTQRGSATTVGSLVIVAAKQRHRKLTAVSETAAEKFTSDIEMAELPPATGKILTSDACAESKATTTACISSDFDSKAKSDDKVSGKAVVGAASENAESRGGLELLASAGDTDSGGKLELVTHCSASPSASSGGDQFRGFPGENATSQQLLNENWFFANQHLFGNSHRVAGDLLCLVTPLIVGVGVISWFPKHAKFGPLFFALVLGVTVVSMVKIARNYPSKRDFTDSLRVYDELRLLGRTALFVVAGYIVFVVVEIVIMIYVRADGQKSRNNSVGFWFELPMSLWTLFGAAALIGVQTEWVRLQFEGNGWVLCCDCRPKQLNLVRQMENSQMSKTGSLDDVLQIVRRIGSKTDLPTPDEIRFVTLEDVIADAQAFRAFMRHLFAEFCYENALGVFEMLEFKRSLLEEADTDKFEDIQFAVGSGVESGIVGDSLLSAEMKYLCLYGKYIDYAAEMCVNISAHCRRDALGRAKQIVEKDATVAHDAFDSCVEELLRRMDDSFERFRITDNFVLPPGTQL